MREMKESAMAPNEITITVNGKQIAAQPDQPLLETIRSAGVEIPTLCYHPALSAYGACRLCLVEVEHEGRKRMMASCSTPSASGMQVWTETEDAIRARRLSMQLILARCSKVDSIWKFAARMGVNDTPFIKRDEDCIQCGLCERVCRELVGSSVVAFSGRGAEREVRVPFDKESETCIGCEACVSVCPTGKVRSKLQDNRLLMETWKTALDLAECSDCGSRFASERLVQRVAIASGQEIVDANLCPVCRRHSQADRYRRAVRAVGGTAIAANENFILKK